MTLVYLRWSSCCCPGGDPNQKINTYKIEFIDFCGFAFLGACCLARRRRLTVASFDVLSCQSSCCVVVLWPCWLLPALLLCLRRALPMFACRAVEHVGAASARCRNISGCCRIVISIAFPLLVHLAHGYSWLRVVSSPRLSSLVVSAPVLAIFQAVSSRCFVPIRTRICAVCRTSWSAFWSEHRDSDAVARQVHVLI